MRYYHGTDYASGLNIIENGFSDADTVWTCSDDSVTYLVSENYDGGPYYEDNYEPKNVPAFGFATGAAQIAAANCNQLTDKVIVFEFEIPDDIELHEDSSCENMYHCYQIDNDTLNEYIRTNKIKMTTYILHKAYVPYLRVFYLKDINLNYYHTCESDLMDILNDLAKVEAYWFYDNYLNQFESYEIIKTNTLLSA